MRNDKYNEDMNQCPYCHRRQNQVKAGRNPSGSQRYYCNYCERIYTPSPKRNGYPRTVRRQAVRLYKEGLSFRAVARELDVGTQSVINWVRAVEPNDNGRNPHEAQTSGEQKEE